MNKTERQLASLRDRIDQITRTKNPAIAAYMERDNSVQAELRLSATWSITARVDTIAYPKRLSPYQQLPPGPSPERDAAWDANDAYNAPWAAMGDEEQEMCRVTLLAKGTPTLTLAASSKSKIGAERRQQAADTWRLETRRAFLAAYRVATGKRRLAEVRRNVAVIQTRQRELLVEIRRRNSEYVAVRSAAKADQQARNVSALASGRFWEADRDAIKGHFRPPFDKNALADVSARWRAALFVECESESYRRYNDQWGHKLVGTGEGYLCGIDDNGDEWGHRVRGLRQSRDGYGSRRPDGTVEEAMASLFGVRVDQLAACVRQGDLLFRPLAAIPAEAALKSAEAWEPRPSHVIEGAGLRHNGRYFDAPVGATITHTSHAAVTLAPGAYCLHVSAADAD